jgi:hypothetical protein
MDIEPAANEIAAMLAWGSENLRTRSSFSAGIFSIFAAVKALTRGFLRLRCSNIQPIRASRKSR